MARFSERMVTEVVQVFWAAMARGGFITDAAAQAGTYRVKGARWLRAEGGCLVPGSNATRGRACTVIERLGRRTAVRRLATRLTFPTSRVRRSLDGRSVTRRRRGCAGEGVEGSVDQPQRAGPVDRVGAVVHSELLVGALGSLLCR